MTTTNIVDLHKSYTQEEQDSMFDAVGQALLENNLETAKRILEGMPIDPAWAKAIHKVMGKEELVSNYNITEANRVFGEGWMDE